MKYIKQHYESWVDFARENDHPEDVRPILVAGVDLTREFATVAYSDNQTRVECEFSAALPGVASTSVSVWGSWHTAGLVHTNCGPYPTWESPSSGESSALEPEIQDEYTQCVFIKYYIFHKRHTIRKRLFLPIVLKAGAGPHQLPKRDREDGNSDEEGLQVLSVDDSTEPGPDHPETGPPGDEFDKVTYNVPTVGPVTLSRPQLLMNWIKDDRDSFDVVAEFIFQVRTSSWNSWYELTHFNRDLTRNPFCCTMMTFKTFSKYVCILVLIPHSHRFRETTKICHGC